MVKTGAINEPIVLGFSSPVDPLSLTPKAVRLLGVGEAEWDWQAQVSQDGREATLLLRLDVGPDHKLLAPSSLRLQGFPSPHALRWTSGGALRAVPAVALTLGEQLAAPGSAAPDLLRVQGAPPAEHEIRIGSTEPLTLLVDGVLDPASLVDGAVRAHPVRGELSLSAVPCELTAVVAGGRTLLELRWPRESGLWEIRTGGMDVRDVLGRSLDPTFVIRVRSD